MHLILDSGIDLQDASDVIDRIQDIPTHLVDLSGSHVEVPTELSWMKFNKTGGAYEVSFLHNLWRREPEFVNKICMQMQHALGIMFSPQHFMLIRTLSDSVVHRDSGPEKCRVNIGLRGSVLSRTVLHELDREVQMQDGEAWLFDPKSQHSVRANDEEGHTTYRYLGSLFLFHPYEDVRSRIGGNYSDPKTLWTNLPQTDYTEKIALVR